VANPDVLTRARATRVLLFDVDGVLTDGAVFLHGDGTESKRFFIRDGTAVVLARRAGLKVGLISGRPSDATLQRVPLLRRVGFAAAPADAVREARDAAHWVSSVPGGAGAVRELVEFILKAQDRWESAVEGYLEHLAAQR
jgi:3-deoxy-D-manno-octulosonate 8-phosphate phosphatase (KDO 8-P phosphatase)